MNAIVNSELLDNEIASLDPKRARMFAIWCARKDMAMFMPFSAVFQPENATAIDVAERHMRGLATDEQLAESEKIVNWLIWSTEAICAVFLPDPYQAARAAARELSRDIAERATRDRDGAYDDCKTSAARTAWERSRVEAIQAAESQVLLDLRTLQLSWKADV